jgi:hypothetical protein
MKLQKLSLFGAVAGALLLTAAFAPKANAVITTDLLVYYNFNQGNGTFPATPYLSVAPGLQIGVPLSNTASAGHTVFPGGTLFVNPTQGTTLNRANPPNTDVAGGALDARGNDSTNAGSYCFTIGPFSTQSHFAISVSFALKSTGSGGFNNLDLSYSTNGTTFTNFASFTNLQSNTTYTTLSANLPTGANNQSTLYIEYCFSGATNNDTHNNTFIDNIQIKGSIPEPSTYIGGFLGLGVVCWSQRRWLIRSLRFGRA